MTSYDWNNQKIKEKNRREPNNETNGLKLSIVSKKLKSNMRKGIELKRKNQIDLIMYI